MDANILFAALLRTGITNILLLRDDLQLYAPVSLLKETDKYMAMIRQRTSLSDTELQRFSKLLRRTITFMEVNSEGFTAPDPADADYLCLAENLGIPLWSNDRLLKEQNLVRVITTAELLALLDASQRDA